MEVKLFSQHGQDKWVLETLQTKRGFFLDTGAYHPTIDSNTYTLETFFGWDGVGVEPNPNMFRLLKEQRKCRLVNAALAETRGIVNYLECGGMSGILEYIGEHDRKRINAIPGYHEPLERLTQPVPSLTIGEVLEQTLAPWYIDYWSLDVEGAELMILKTFPWDKYKVKLMTVEHNDHVPKRLEVQKFLAERGFKCLPNLLCPWEDHFINESI